MLSFYLRCSTRVCLSATSSRLQRYQTLLTWTSGARSVCLWDIRDGETYEREKKIRKTHFSRARSVWQGNETFVTLTSGARSVWQGYQTLVIFTSGAKSVWQGYQCTSNLTQSLLQLLWFSWKYSMLGAQQSWLPGFGWNGSGYLCRGKVSAIATYFILHWKTCENPHINI